METETVEALATNLFGTKPYIEFLFRYGINMLP
jgi:hypothetical protein